MRAPVTPIGAPPFRAWPRSLFVVPVKGEWHDIEEDLFALDFALSAQDWDLFDYWRDLWSAA